jgi:hypothetical protein
VTPGQKLWIKAIFFTVGTGAYIGLYVWFLVETFGATTEHPPTIPGEWETLAITLSAAVGGYLAKVLGFRTRAATGFSCAPASRPHPNG